ncbi:MAG: hypothetical protein ACRBCL_12625 [Maritimibacter sp.]
MNMALRLERVAKPWRTAPGLLLGRAVVAGSGALFERAAGFGSGLDAQALWRAKLSSLRGVRLRSKTSLTTRTGKCENILRGINVPKPLNSPKPFSENKTSKGPKSELREWLKEIEND